MTVVREYGLRLRENAEKRSQSLIKAIEEELSIVTEQKEQYKEAIIEKTVALNLIRDRLVLEELRI